jgi:uncharacterized protein
MDVALNGHEARVLGVLIEKGYCTPDQYPLTLNATTNGSNQKSNRHPVTDYSEAEVVIALTGLKFKHLVGASTPAGSRVEKYRHNAAEHLKLGDRELAVLAELLLRGPQAQGELRQRANRMRSIPGLDELSQVLASLMERGFVKRLPPAPGSRAERYGQLIGDAPPVAQTPAPAPTATAAPATSPAHGGGSLGSRVEALEHQVTRLQAQLSKLAEQLGAELE